MPPSAAGTFSAITARSVLSCCAAFALHSACLGSQREGIYLIEDNREAIQLSDQAWGANARLLIAEADTLPAERGQGARRALPRGDRFTEIVAAAARAHRIAPELLHAVIAAESGYAVRAVSARGAQGLMQLMPATARGYGVTDPFDPHQNVNAGAQHLRHLLDQFDQDTALALAAYNAGAAAVVRHRHSIPPFTETAAYVPRVLRHFAQLTAPGPGRPSPPPRGQENSGAALHFLERAAPASALTTRP